MLAVIDGTDDDAEVVHHATAIAAAGGGRIGFVELRAHTGRRSGHRPFAPARAHGPRRWPPRMRSASRSIFRAGG
ncbi:MAG: hypothetical protein KIT28_01415 [Rubrivivax sp.]|nr:hypothetical protein [Rubrivivax sp.]